MFRVFLSFVNFRLFCIIISCVIAGSSNIAVCISGQDGRMIPSGITKLFVDNPNSNFYLFYNIQSSKTIAEIVFNTLPNKGNGTAEYFNMDVNYMKRRLVRLYSPLANVKVENATLDHAVNRTLWQQYFRHKRLDLIKQYISTQQTIFNMWKKQVECSKQILSWENHNKLKFDYIFNTREDLYVLNQINLTNILPHLSDYKSLDSNNSVCNVIGRSCLSWNGMNLRLQIMSREVGMKLLSTRFKYYLHAYNSIPRIKAFTVEEFELRQLKWLGYHWCGVDVELLPIVVARTKPHNSSIPHTEVSISNQGSNICFLKEELEWNVQHEKCYPNNDNIKKFLFDNLC